ncbi:MAG: hypothetical protein IKC11_03335 [Clostridia bacterium]|nr:hypothetical protein [Clostridia bacterium]
MNNRFEHYFKDLKAVGVDKLASKLSCGQKVQRVHIDGASYYVKRVANKQMIPAIASSRMYQEIGILTPPMYMLKSKEKGYTKTIEQEVKSIDGLLCELANSNVEFTKIETRAFGKDKWALFYDEDLVYTLCKYMYPECIEGLKDLFLCDELRTDVDRHSKNYFMYKFEGDKKYRGVVAIDLEQMVVFKYCGASKKDFESFIYYPYQSATPQQVSDELCYLQRVRNIRELIEEGVLSGQNINALKKELSYDLPKEIKKVASERGLHGIEKRCLVSPIERLWEYNQKTIGKDLGL